MSGKTNTLTALRALSPCPVSSYLPIETLTLRCMKVAKVRMEYDGRFGERDISLVRCEDSEGNEVSMDSSSSAMEEIQVFFRELLELRFPEWERGEGSLGYFEWRVDADTLEHRHTLRVIELRTLTIDND